jgi:hypothetical protein
VPVDPVVAASTAPAVVPVAPVAASAVPAVAPAARRRSARARCPVPVAVPVVPAVAPAAPVAVARVAVEAVVVATARSCSRRTS